MSEFKKIEINYKNKNISIVIEKSEKFEIFKEKVAKMFDINSNQYQIKLFIEGVETLEIDCNFWERNILYIDKIILDIVGYCEVLDNIILSESLKLERNKCSNNYEGSSSVSFTIESVSMSRITSNNKIHEIIRQSSDSSNDNHAIEEDKNYALLGRDYVIIPKKEVLEEIDIESNSICGICCDLISNNLYSCLFCENIELCEKCEINHIHPVIRFPSKTMKNKKDLIDFISRVNETEIKPSLIQSLDYNYFFQKINSFLLLGSICVAEINFTQKEMLIAPNSYFNLPIKINNLSINKKICKGFNIYPINNRDLEVENLILEKELNPGQSLDMILKCKSQDKLSKYEIKFVMFKNNEDLISICKESIIITVGFDESLNYNQFFNNYDKILSLPLLKKKIIYEIIINELSSKNPIEIYRILERNRWRPEEALEELL